MATRLAMLTSTGAISPLLAHFIQTKGLFKQDGLKSMIDEGLDTQLLESSALPLTVALHLTAANRVDYCQVDNPHTAADMLLGTAALPLIFDDVRINGNTYTDGGFYWGLPQKRLDNTPIVPLIESECDTTVVVYLSPDDLSINPHHYPGVRILPIIPANNLGGLTATLDFSNEGAAWRIEQGYHEAIQIFRHLDLFSENEVQYEALWQRVQLTAEQERRGNESLLNIDGQHRRAIRDIRTESYEVSTSRWYNPFSWGSSETRYRDVVTIYASTQDAIEQLETFALQSTSSLQNAIVGCVDLDGLRREVGRVAMSLFDTGDASFDAELMLAEVNKSLRRITIPDVDFGRKDYSQASIKVFGSGRVCGDQINALKEAQREAVTLILTDLEAEVERKITAIGSSLESTGKTFVERMVDDIWNSLTQLRNDIANKEMSLQLIEDAQAVVAKNLAKLDATLSLS